jgi:membrane carboxypeptidase/penicillin-binding protein
VVKPILIRRVEDRDGNVLLNEEPQLSRAFSETTSFLMANMLADVVNAGTGYRARATGFNLPAAGKTGTTNDYVDAWFVGFTPRLVAGVWVGFDQPQTIVSGGYGGELAVPLWGEFMKVATKGNKSEWLKRPSNVVGVDICRMSGKRPSDGCSHVEVMTKTGEHQIRSMVYTEYFAAGTEPYDSCRLHDSGNMFQRMAGLFGGRKEPQSVPIETTGLPDKSKEQTPTPAVVETSPTAVPAPSAPEPEKKKRGFWSRVFGKRDKEEKKP